MKEDHRLIRCVEKYLVDNGPKTTKKLIHEIHEALFYIPSDDAPDSHQVPEDDLKIDFEPYTVESVEYLPVFTDRGKMIQHTEGLTDFYIARMLRVYDVLKAHEELEGLIINPNDEAYIITKDTMDKILKEL